MRGRVLNVGFELWLFGFGISDEWSTLQSKKLFYELFSN